MRLKGDDITYCINVKHICQEFSLFQIKRSGDYFSAGPIREAGLSTNEIEAVSRRLSRAEFQPAQAQATHAGLSLLN